MKKGHLESLPMVRKIDELGRVTLPKPYRQLLGMEEGSTVGLYFQGDKIIVGKYAKECVKCHSNDDLIELTEGVAICASCATIAGLKAEELTQKNLIRE